MFRLQPDKRDFCFFTTSLNELDILFFAKNNFFKFKANINDDTIQRWARNVQLSPDEYVSQLKDALLEQQKNESTIDDAPTKSESGQSLRNDFLVEDDSLLWKQFFVDKGIYGRKGKFPLEKISHEEGISSLFQVGFREMVRYQQLLTKSREENLNLTQQLSYAKDIAAQSVKIQSEFEKEIYGKFAAILNQKKKYIRQLKQQSDGFVDFPEEKKPEISATTSSSLTDKNINNSSDEYDADTDVDENDEDNKNGELLSSLKRKQGTQNSYFDIKKSKS